MKRLTLLLTLILTLALAGTGVAGIIDTYPTSNYTTDSQLRSGAYEGYAQSLTGNGVAPPSANIYIKKVGSPTGTVYARIYAVTGTPGTSAKPTGSALFSSTGIDVSTLSTTYSLVEFYFISPTALTNGTHYELSIEYTGGNSSNYIYVGMGGVLAGYNYAHTSDLVSWAGANTYNVCFQLLDTATYTIVSSTGANGAISPTGYNTYNPGNTPVYTFTPNYPYQVADVLVDGSSVLGSVVNNTYTFPALSAGHTISVTFSRISNSVFYLRTDGNDSNNGSADTSGGAFLTFAAAQTAAQTGDNIYARGAFAANATVTKGVTIAPTPGATATLGGIYTFSTTGVTVGAVTMNGFVLNNGSGVTWNNTNFGPTSVSSGSIFSIYGGTYVFNYPRFCSSIVTNANPALGTEAGVSALNNASTVTFNYPVWECFSGPPSIAVNGCNWTFNNPLFAYAGIGWGNEIRLNNYTGTFTFNNPMFIGEFPVTKGASPTVVVNTPIWHTQPKISSPVTTFADNMTGVTVNGGFSNTNPLLKNLHRCSLGSILVRVDDLNNSANAAQTAVDMNPQIKVSYAANLHSIYDPPTTQNVLDMRYLVDNGNEVMSHSGTHTDNSTLNRLNLTCPTATTFSAVLAGVRSGDSNTWTGTLIITVNGVPDTTIDLTSTSTGGQNVSRNDGLIAYLNGRVVNGQALACSYYNANISSTGKTLCLADQTISSPTGGILIADDSKEIHFEWVEAIADIQAYIQTGSDRNGQNPSGAGAAGVGTPSSSYVCTAVVAPYGLSRASVLSDPTNGLMTTEPQLVGGVKISTNDQSASLVYGYGTLQSFGKSLFGMPYQQTDGGTLGDQEEFAFCMQALVSPSIVQLLAHGTEFTYGGTVAGFKALLLAYGLGGQTFSQAINSVTSNHDFTVTSSSSDRLIQFNWSNIENYVGQGDFHVTASSPLVKAGTHVAGLTQDWYGGTVHNPPNIGIDDNQLFGSSPMGLGLGMGLGGFPGWQHRPTQ